MAHVGEKRTAEKEVPKDEGEAETPPPKRPALSGGFSFRPSTLTKSTEGFLKPSSFKLEPPELSDTPAAAEPDADEVLQPADSPEGAFQKLDTEDLPSITMTTSIMTTGGGGSIKSVGGPRGIGSSGLRATDQKRDGMPAGNHNDVEKSKNPCPHFLSTSSSETFSSLSGSGGDNSRVGATFVSPYSSHQEGQGNNGANSTLDKDDSRESEADSSVVSDSFLSRPMFPFGSQPVTAMLPEIQPHTGEESEKNIVQIPARLYVFDAVTHSWKDRGRGEVRLNDVCQSEGVFQSRLVMRTSGSYHVLMNTHLWAQMKCSRANQKSIRITAQGPQAVSIFLIMGAPKDIQQLFTAIDRRLEALRRNTVQERVESQQEDPDFNFDEDDESLLDDPNSSPDSSPDPHSHARRLRQVDNPVPIPKQQSVSTPDQPGSEDEAHESVDTSSNKNLAAEKESPTVETESGVDSTSV